jgi:protein tyrosine phosphatase
MTITTETNQADTQYDRYYGTHIDKNKQKFMPTVSDKYQQYINASNITLGNNNKYVAIATQAPLPNTFVHFWSMVWYYRTNLIIMLTKTVENNKIKAHTYFPTKLNQTASFGPISIKLTSIDCKESYTVRTVQIINTEENDSYDLMHIQYVAWPDFGVPTEHNDLKKIVDVTVANIKTGGIPIVHCSAGVGRTGAFLAIVNYIVLSKNFTATARIASIVNNLREQRDGMVQTDEQYKFIGDFLAKCTPTQPINLNPLKVASNSLNNCWNRSGR